MKKVAFLLAFPFLLMQSCSGGDIVNPKQDQFIKKIESFQTRYDESDGNDVAQELTADQMTKFIEKYGEIKDWTGTVIEVNSSLGDSWIVVKPTNSDVILFKLWPEGGVIENTSKWKETDLYKILPILKIDEQIKFSGKIVSEMSLTESGMMSEPEIRIEPLKISIIKE
jgi:hypothetical protein